MLDYDNINFLITELAKDPNNPALNLKLGYEYEAVGQLAAAITFYLKAAEYGHDIDKEIAYIGILRLGLCLEKQDGRNWSVSNSFLQAISILPDRPEAYLALSRFYEKKGDWQECYTAASTGLLMHEKEYASLKYDVAYPGKYSLEFQKALSGWWVGKIDESRDLFLSISQKQNIAPEYKQIANNNLRMLGVEVDKICIVLPVRNNKSYRAERLKGCLKSWQEQTEGLSDLHILVDEDEVEEFAFLKDNPRYTIHIIPVGVTLMQKVNIVAPMLANKYKYLAFVGDDIVFKTKWESRFIEYLSSVPAGMAFCDTVHRKDELATHPVITSNMVRALGFYGCPYVHHNYFDNFWMDVCRELGTIKYFDDIIWDHARSGWVPDEMYWKIVNLQAEDEVRYNSYKETKYQQDLEKIKKAIA